MASEINAETTHYEKIIDKGRKILKEKGLHQPGIAFPSPSDQEHLLIIRLDITGAVFGQPVNIAKENVKKGLNNLFSLFDRIRKGDKRIDVLNANGLIESKDLVKEFYFSATVGFATPFFEQLNIPQEKQPKNLREMPDHEGLGDVAPYSLGQTDMIIQLCSSKDFVNRWVLENTIQPVEEISDERICPDGQHLSSDDDKCITDIVSAIKGWATITDIHAGFQRVDGRNLQGFNDGVSNPKPAANDGLFDNIVWTTKDDEANPNLAGGTYMVFQKIEHDLDQWRELSLDEQQEWVGRSKGTALLLGTLKEDEDNQLALDLKSTDDNTRLNAANDLKILLDLQKNPLERFYDESRPDIQVRGRRKAYTISFKRIHDSVQAWSHVRKANPRQEDGTEPKIIFRRGYPFFETGLNNKIKSGLLFICFQKDIKNGFEFIKKNWFNNKNFPVHILRDFNATEIIKRHKAGRLTVDELNNLTADQKDILGLTDPEEFDKALEEARDPDTQNTGREGLAGPSEHGTVPTGEFLAIVPFGGGYYFVPPIKNDEYKNITDLFFE